MKVLLQGIATAFNADTGAGGLNHATTGLTGGLHLMAAPDSAVEPYGVVFIVDNTYDGTFDDDIEQFRIQFSLFDKNPSPSALADLFEAQKTLFDDVTLTVTGYTNYFFKRDITTGPERDIDNVWMYRTDYLASLHKN